MSYVVDLDAYFDRRERESERASRAFDEFREQVARAVLRALQRENHDPGDEDRSERMSWKRMHVDRRDVVLRCGGVVSIELRVPDMLRMSESDRQLLSSVVQHIDRYESERR